jgi:S-adenosylmethionine synthetase
MTPDFVFTSESVTRGHPDKLCDRISDAIVGRLLRQAPLARVTAECAVSTGLVFLAVKRTAEGNLDLAQTARKIIGDVGYGSDGFGPRVCSVMTSVAEFEPEERSSFDESELDEEALEAVPAREPVTVFGFACNQTPERMPLPIVLAHRIARRLDEVGTSGLLPYLSPDGKVQVAVEFGDRMPKRIYAVTVVATHRDDAAPLLEALRQGIRETVVDAVFEDEPIRPDERSQIAINPQGLSRGGPAVHSGLTGRKTGVDTYGEYSRNSGSALSGKDPTRIDRVAAYAARHAAKNIVAAKLADECEVMLSYAIGRARPVSIQVETFGTARVDEREIVRRMRASLDFRPAAIVRDFELRRLPSRQSDGFYPALAAYGHVGRTDLDLPWERIDRVEALAK